MARKRKSGNKNRTSGHSAITRIDRPVNPFVRKRSRYSGKYLTLAIMGGAAFFILKGCSDDAGADNDGDGTFYSAVSDCIDDGNSAAVCADGWNSAKSEFYSNLPMQMSSESCQKQFGNCYLDSTDHSWVPVFAGFLLSRVVKIATNSMFTTAAVHPMFRVRSGVRLPGITAGVPVVEKMIPRPAIAIRQRKFRRFHAVATGVRPARVGTGEVNDAAT